MKGTLILRVGLALVFVYFAYSQFMDPELYSSYLPLSLQGANATTLIYVNGFIDALLAITIGFSIFPHIAPLIGSIHLFVIAAGLGLNDLGVRDFGLAMACLSLVFIHEEHVPNTMKALIGRLTGKGGTH